MFKPIQVPNEKKLVKYFIKTFKKKDRFVNENDITLSLRSTYTDLKKPNNPLLRAMICPFSTLSSIEESIVATT